jgi:hypothetical protein
VEPEFLDEGKSTQRYLGKRFFPDIVKPDCNAAVPGLIPASLTAFGGAARIMTVYKKKLISGCEASFPE